MVDELFRKIARPTKKATQTVTQAAIITLNATGMLFANIMRVIIKRLNERLPIIGGNSVVCNSHVYYFIAQPISGQLAPVAPNICDYFAAFTVICVY